jgi:putative transposase
MKRTRFTEEQIVAILKQSEAGLKTAEICRQNGISEATSTTWKAKYGGMGVSNVQKLKRLEEENTKLKRVVADLTLDNVVLKDLLGKTSRACKQAGRGDSRDRAARDQRTPRLQVDTVGALHTEEKAARQRRGRCCATPDGTGS